MRWSNTTNYGSHFLFKLYYFMEIYLVRHTTPAIEKGVCYGQTDLNVAETFEEEVELVLKNLEIFLLIVLKPFSSHDSIKVV